MKHLSTPDDLLAMQDRQMTLRSNQRSTIVIPAGTCAQAYGVNEIIRTAKAEVLENYLAHRMHLRITGCHGDCAHEPSVLLEPSQTYYPNVGAEDIPRIIKEGIDAMESGNLHTSIDLLAGESLRRDELPFFKHQRRRILRKSELSDPMHISDYLGAGGYSSLIRIIAMENPANAFSILRSSGIRERHGDGRVIADAWENFSTVSYREKYNLICHADEGDAYASINRNILEANPHLLIEAMLICALLTNATEGIIYLSSHFDLALKHLRLALQQCEEIGLLGKNILGTGKEFHLHLVPGTGSFFGISAPMLMHFLEVDLGEIGAQNEAARTSPSHDESTLLHDAETWMNIPLLFEEYAQGKFSDDASHGSKLAHLHGLAGNAGVIEIPNGMSLHDMLMQFGEVKTMDALKAVVLLGDGAHLLPTHRGELQNLLNVEGERWILRDVGSIIPIDGSACIVDLASYFASKLKNELRTSCAACAEHAVKIHALVDACTKGTSSSSSLDSLTALAHSLKEKCRCHGGKTVGQFVFDGLQHFRQEFEAHQRKTCSAMVCRFGN